MDRLDRDWLAAHPLPVHDPDADKNERGRVLVIGGARFVPGALRLTGEAALRAGCGKLQLATIDEAAMALGVLVPEAAMIALPADADGEIGAGAVELLGRALDNCDCVILGPGMVDHAPATPLVEALFDTRRERLRIVLDAAAITCAAHHPRSEARRLVLTPHPGEMEALTGATGEAILDDPARAAAEAAARFGAVIVLKSSRTIVAGPSGEIAR
ncbi:MAG: NAD(P)H-hydrate dehydratase, partial [Sphingomonadaceae bacterium]|nr:NAD(P)H-hydrate dehydratase [Sphingomonadaceae bacterium]